MKSLEIMAEDEKNNKFNLSCTSDKQLRHLDQIKSYEQIDKEKLTPIGTAIITGESLFLQWNNDSLVITDALIPDEARAFISGKAKYGYRERTYFGSSDSELIKQCYIPVTFFR